MCSLCSSYNCDLCDELGVFERRIRGRRQVHFLQPVQLVFPWSLGAAIFSVKLAVEDLLEGRQPIVLSQSGLEGYGVAGRIIDCIYKKRKTDYRSYPGLLII
jgi:hypothetical protein